MTLEANLRFMLDVPRYRWELGIVEGVDCLIPKEPRSTERFDGRADLFDFIRRLPMTWDETRILHGDIGKFITTARRSGERWFVASATNEQERTLPIALEFLDAGKKYTATLYEDAPDAHFQTNREAYRVRQLEVTRDTIIDARMAPGGGHCIYLESE